MSHEQAVAVVTVLAGCGVIAGLALVAAAICTLLPSREDTPGMSKLVTNGSTIETAKAKVAYEDAIDILNYAQNRHLLNPRSDRHARVHDHARQAKDRAKRAYRQAKVDALLAGDL